MIYQNRIKYIFSGSSYTLVDADIGKKIIYKGALPFTLVMPGDPTWYSGFNIDVYNAGTMRVTCNSVQIPPNTHAHISSTGAATWVVSVSADPNHTHDGYITEADVTTILGDYYTSGEVDTLLLDKSDAGHDHNTIYYTSGATDTLLSDKADAEHDHAGVYLTPTEVATLLLDKSDAGHDHNDLYNTKEEITTLLSELPAGEVTKEAVEEVLTGEIESHYHPGAEPHLTEFTTFSVGYTIQINGTVSAEADSLIVTGVGTSFLTNLSTVHGESGNVFRVGNVLRRVISIETDTSLTVDKVFEVAFADSNCYANMRGNDANDGSSDDAEHALATIGEVFNRIPKYIDEYVWIIVAHLSYDYLEIHDYVGSATGYIQIQSTGNVNSNDKSYAEIEGVDIGRNTNLPIAFQEINIVNEGGFYANSSKAELIRCRIDGDGVYAYPGARVSVYDCSISNTPAAITASGGIAIVNKISGTSNDDIFYLEEGGTIVHDESEDVSTITGTVLVYEPCIGTIFSALNGETAQRPRIVNIGYKYFDTTLGIPIWFSGTNWVDATGTVV